METPHGKAGDGSNDDEERDRTLGSRLWVKSKLCASHLRLRAARGLWDGTRGSSRSWLGSVADLDRARMQS